MSRVSIYRIHKKGYLLFAVVRSVSGFGIGIEPYIQISEDNANQNIIADAINRLLSIDDSNRVPDPKNWKEFDNEFLSKTGLKSLKELNKATTFYCGIEKKDGSIIFKPTKHAEKPDEGFVNKNKNEPNIVIPLSASNQEIAEALELAFSKCE